MKIAFDLLDVGWPEKADKAFYRVSVCDTGVELSTS